MTDKELAQAVLSTAVETGSLVCLGCGHEHDCGIHGCAILRQAGVRLESQATEIVDLRARLAEKDKQLATEVEDMHRMHALCMEEGGCCSECGSQNDALLDAACDFCTGSGVSCWKGDVDNPSWCTAFRWRGAQEAGEGGG